MANMYNNQNQTQVPYSYGPSEINQGPCVVAPPPVGYPTKDGELGQGKNFPPTETKSRGDGFLKGCCAALCCCCMLDACF